MSIAKQCECGANGGCVACEGVCERPAFAGAVQNKGGAFGLCEACDLCRTTQTLQTDDGYAVEGGPEGATFVVFHGGRPENAQLLVGAATPSVPKLLKHCADMAGFPESVVMQVFDHHAGEFPAAVLFVQLGDRSLCWRGGMWFLSRHGHEGADPREQFQRSAIVNAWTRFEASAMQTGNLGRIVATRAKALRDEAMERNDTELAAAIRVALGSQTLRDMDRRSAIRIVCRTLRDRELEAIR